MILTNHGGYKTLTGAFSVVANLKFEFNIILLYLMNKILQCDSALYHMPK